ncbi:hypothetical protein RHSIM_Rhsim08G0027300 [Rhododendron simsii]|uniref:Rab escort protein 1 n=1 Tax=Rhododendron simsii TaxID=118357 RepID=A0A834LGW8_RHOSS|nr:hypothetical protein RHSIM_Rhsim08G0027300 [Rhododendron simsii]
MDDPTAFSYPPIDPTTFDVIIIGTGLPESILAAASSAAGNTVLHLDPNPFYGSHFSSLPLSDVPSFLLSHSHAVPLPLDVLTTPSPSDAVLVPVDLTTRPVYSHIEISSHSHSTDLLEHSRKFNLDLAGPRVLFCADSAVDLMLKSGANQYVEFKNVDGTYVCGGDGKLSSVPDSRSAVFKDASLGLMEKNRLGSFFKLVEGHLKGTGSDGGRRISEEDLERPFVEFLDKIRLSTEIKSIIMYAIAMADYDQDKLEGCRSVLKTKDGINRLALYHSSVGRFHNALGALIYPIYGQGELCQAFCRRAAVKGCLYVLRMQVKALLVDKESGSCKGAKLASGQDLFSNEMVLGPSFMTLSPLANSSPDFLQAKFTDIGRGVRGKVARGICITNSSLKTDVSTCLVVFPPKCHINPSSSDRFVVYLSTLCDDDIQGKKSLHAAMNTIFSVPISETPENSSNDKSEDTEVKPTLLWSALYIQEMTTGSFDSFRFTPMPDGNLNYNDLLDAIKELFHKMFPEEEFFPETTFSQLDDAGELAPSELAPSPNDDSLDS